jgi:hypothetical protein
MAELSTEAPRWIRGLLSRLASDEDRDEVLGDLEEAHRARLARHRRLLATVLTRIEALDMARAILRERRRAGRARARSGGRGNGLRAAGLGRSTISWLDVKLGVRMLIKHPGLSLVSGFGMAVAVAIGAVGFGVIHTLTASHLPLDEGDRLVTIQNTGAAGMEQIRGTHLHDFATWRDEVPALSDVGAYRILTRNLVSADGRVAPFRVVEMTASGFRIARVPPLLGRHLIDADERKSAPPVVVIGYGVWQDRFGGRPDVLGEQVELGAASHTVVGVMPRDFAFPINNRVWTPLKLDPQDFGRGRAPPIDVFGRLAPGATQDEAQERLSALGQRAAAADPDTYEGVEPRVFPYAQESSC